MNVHNRIIMAAMLLGGLALPACNPCFGVEACSTDPQLNYTGRVMDRETGVAMPGVKISYIRTGGVEMDHDTLRATSDEDGFFTLHADAAEVGWVDGQFVVEPTDKPSYLVPEVRLHAQRRGGEGGDLGTIVTQPYYIFIGELKDSAGRLMPATIGFRRTGGVLATPTDTTVSTSDGYFYIVFRAESYGQIHGEFTVTPAAGGAAKVLPVTIYTSHTIHRPYATPLNY